MRSLRASALLLAALGLSGCFDDPVKQRLELRFRPDGAVEVEARVRVRHPDGMTDGKGVRERTEEVRAQLAADGLGWPSRFSRLAPERRRFVLEYEGEELRQGTFRALVADPTSLEKLLPEGLVRVLFQRSEEGVSELVLLIEPGSRGNRRQQEIVKQREERIAAAYLDYLEAAEDLVVLLEDRPERASALLWHVLGGEDTLVVTTPEEPDLQEDEVPTVERVTAAMEQVLDVFSEEPEGERRTINELSRLVHDPFEFDVIVRLPEAPLESEGFLNDGDSRSWKAPRRSLTQAIEQLSQRWIEPDWLVMLWSGPWREDGSKLDVNTLAALPRRADPPLSTTDVRAALEEALRPPGLLRLRWRSPPPPDQGVVDWEEAARQP